MSSENQNPRKWRYTWEAQSHLPLLKLFIFSPEINPITHCNHLNVDLIFEKSLITFTWKLHDSSNSISLLIPLPRVLVDLDSPLNFRPFEDHIQVQIPLLLPVDHPIVSSFISELNSSDQFSACNSSQSFLQPLSIDSDFKALSSKGDVHFYCRNCDYKLTKRSIRCLVDLPSVNWTDVADNWFGTCCCSFGGISEKLVAKYVKSYRCAEGTCLLTTASVILCKDDIAGFKSREVDLNNSGDNEGSIDIPCKPDNDSSPKHGSENIPTEKNSMSRESVEPDDDQRKSPSCPLPRVDSATDDEIAHSCCEHDALGSGQIINEPVALQADQKSFLNCYLGNAFLFRSDGLSKDIEWIDFACPQCSFTLGAYPCSDGSEPLDGGIRLLKCYISISPPSKSSDDLFSKYTLERMFTCQLLESAKDELSFRSVVKDLKTKSSLVHIVLLNPNSWCCSGYCSEDTVEPFVKINLHPVVKVLFSQCYDKPDSILRFARLCSKLSIELQPEL
ncbi:uncharacterized protein LOC104895074 isoform X2 [Beta vulgaris subsp. vulgaris]|uniref:uncharacterized protein LOC104895074 isoform X2 n=1 Tax=Beta vulgaris subsp. vulgaris TaxID=3555 RepID=UPI002036D71B|nr:uncharacterized protein LOC104895074 isoform X2 [Beta vulgaris subsp. vulgaris]XP_048493746.1 uncharacterized protein LOC104895074 isoform X2 [Beta vulgaris subsp. vulgaris]